MGPTAQDIAKVLLRVPRQPQQDYSGLSGNPFENSVPQADIESARSTGAMYGLPFAEYGNDDPAKKFQADNYTAAFLLSRKHPLMALGFDPARHYQATPDDMRALSPGREPVGAYLPGLDALATAAIPGNGMFSPTTLAHESGHRGLDMLRRAYPDDETLPMFSTPDNEEALMRYVEHTATGEMPTPDVLRRFPLMQTNKFGGLADDVEKLAQDLYYARNNRRSK